MKATPHIAPEVSVTPIDTPQGIRYRVTPAGRGGGTLVPARTAVTLLLMDGDHDLSQIHARLLRLGIKIPDPAKLLAMVRLFESAGVIEITHHYVTPGPLRHVCEGCGQSCQGHLVGPIDTAEATELEARLIDLRRRFPDIPEGQATAEVEYEGETHRVLNFPDGVCIFLDENRLCRLHATFGPHSKPLPCRMFPIRMVRTETGTRVSISPRCFRAHHSYREAAEQTADDLMAEWGVWRPPALVQGLDPANSESLTRSESADANRIAERLMLRQLDRSDRDLSAWLSAVATIDPDAASASAEQRKRFGEAVLVAMQEALRGRFEPPPPGRDRPSRFAANVAEFMSDLLSLRAIGLPDWNDLPEAALDYVRHALRHLVFAREVTAYGNVRTGVLAFAMGVMAARWLVGTSAFERGEPFDAFVTRMTVWVRLSGAREFQTVLFPSRERIDALFNTLIGGLDG